MRSLASLASVCGLLAFAGPALAGPACTGQGPKMTEAQVQQAYKAKGYEIQKWKVDKGGCYEIYGRKDGRKVEVYIDPWTAKAVKEEVG
jgi:hypothetical protein